VTLNELYVSGVVVPTVQVRHVCYVRHIMHPNILHSVKENISSSPIIIGFTQCAVPP